MFSWSAPGPQVVRISAMSADRVIGRDDGMPWDVPQEYQHFLDTTRDASLILGRRSYEIFGPTLTSARCFVVTRHPDRFTPWLKIYMKDYSDRIFGSDLIAAARA